MNGSLFLILIETWKIILEELNSFFKKTKTKNQNLIELKVQICSQISG